MKLHEFLALIMDEEARIELEIDLNEDDYTYSQFWLSDYRECPSLNVSKKYKDFEVTGIGFMPEESHADIVLHINKK